MHVLHTEKEIVYRSKFRKYIQSESRDFMASPIVIDCTAWYVKLCNTLISVNKKYQNTPLVFVKLSTTCISFARKAHINKLYIIDQRCMTYAFFRYCKATFALYQNQRDYTAKKKQTPEACLIVHDI